MLMLNMAKKYINLYKYELSLFDRDDTKQARSFIFIVVPQVEQFPKEKKKKLMLDVVRAYDTSNYKLT